MVKIFACDLNKLKHKKIVNEKKTFLFTGLYPSTCMLLLCLICEFRNELLVLVANLFFHVEFTENVKIDLTGAIQMFTNTGT